MYVMYICAKDIDLASLVDFSIIFWRCSDSVSFLSIFLLYFGGVPTVCHLLSIFLLYCGGVPTVRHLLSIFLLYCGGVPTVCHSCRFFYYIVEVFRQCVILCFSYYYCYYLSINKNTEISLVRIFVFILIFKTGQVNNLSIFVFIYKMYIS